MIIGFARTPTGKQIAGVDIQRCDLAGAEVEKPFSEQISSIGTRAQLDAALQWVRAVTLRHLNRDTDTRAPEGRLMLTMLGGMFQVEREIMLNGQREGIAKAKAEEGKVPSINPVKR